jgi:hypothetical protein
MNRYGLREGLLLRMLADSANGLATPNSQLRAPSS